jgi:hypothetical protein
MVVVDEDLGGDTRHVVHVVDRYLRRLIRAGGRTIAELREEVEAIKHFITGADQATEVTVDYVYDVPGISAEILVDYHHGRSRRDTAAAELRRANDELGAKARATAAALRAAGLSVRDSAAVMSLSKSRFEQLCQASAG